MTDDPEVKAPSDSTRPFSDESDTLAALMDGTITVDDLPDEDLGRLLRTLGPEELLHVVGASPKLFPESMHAAFASRPDVEVDRSPRANARRPAFVLAAAGILLAVAAGVAVYRSSSPAPEVSGNADPGVVSPRAESDPVQPGTPASRPAPVILTAMAGDASGARTPEFRGGDATAREPRATGTVVAVEDARVTLDLGALDGLERGARLEVVRDQTATGTVTIERVFRERASGTFEGAPQAGDIVRVPLAIQATALVSASADRLASSDLAGARVFAQRAVERTRTEPAAAAARVRALAMVGAIDREAGNFEAAETSLRAALKELDGGAAVPGAEAAEFVNELGAVLIARGQIDEAVRLLQRANSQARGATAVRVANNLASALALAGERRTAEQHYREAIDRAAKLPALDRERRVIQQNLDALTPQ